MPLFISHLNHHFCSFTLLLNLRSGLNGHILRVSLIIHLAQSPLPLIVLSTFLIPSTIQTSIATSSSPSSLHPHRCLRPRNTHALLHRSIQSYLHSQPVHQNHPTRFPTFIPIPIPRSRSPSDGTPLTTAITPINILDPATTSPSPTPPLSPASPPPHHSPSPARERSQTPP